ncbi:UNVERIFIED_CONTAM: hypothetical protein FKN15_058940 [Acipenser sinensis]
MYKVDAYMERWHAHQRELKEGGATWCLACLEYGHLPEVCPYEDPLFVQAFDRGEVETAEEWIHLKAIPSPQVDQETCLTCLKGEEWCFAVGKVGHKPPDQPPPWQEVELAQEKVRRQRGGKERRKQREPRWCTMCIAYGHEDEDCPEQEPEDEEPERPAPEWEEPERPVPEWEELERPEPKRGNSVRPEPKRGESVRPEPKRGESVRPEPKRGESVRPEPKRGESNCQNSTAGDYCEECLAGYVHDTAEEGQLICKPCACPFPISSNNFAVSCEKKGSAVRCMCKEGYSGPICERCAPGYYGNPLLIGGTCKKCNCNGNSDPNLIFSDCHNTTGHCQNCWHKTTGVNCERCAPGYYGDAIGAKSCRECNCDTCGTDSCDHRTGRCYCKPGVTGPYCDRCENATVIRVAQTPVMTGPEGVIASQESQALTVTAVRRCVCGVASVNEICNPVTEACVCQPGAAGLRCERCKNGYWNYGPSGCQKCDCAGGSCNSETGQCLSVPVIPPSTNACDITCDKCIWDLIEDLRFSNESMKEIKANMVNISSGAAANNRLNHLNTTTQHLKSQLSGWRNQSEHRLLQTDDVEDVVANLQSDLNSLGEKENIMISEGLEVEKETQDTYRRADHLEKQLIVVSKSIQDIIGKLIYYSSQHDLSAEESTWRKEDAEEMVNTMRKLNLSLNEPIATEESMKANQILRRVLQLEKKLNSTTGLVSPIQHELSELSSRLSDTRELLEGAVRTTQQAEEKHKENLVRFQENENLQQKLRKDYGHANETLRVAGDIIIDTGLDVGELETMIKNVSEFHAAIDGANKLLREREANLSRYDKDLVHRATDYAKELRKLAAELENYLKNIDANGFVQKAINASNVYENIAKYVEEANETAVITFNYTERAEDAIFGINTQIGFLKDRSETLLIEATKLMQSEEETGKHRVTVPLSRAANYFFDGTGYALVRNIEKREKFGKILTRFDLGVRSVMDDALLLLMVNGSNFFTLEMQKGLLRIVYDFGFSNGPVVLEDNLKKIQINDARYHEISVIYHNSKKIILVVDRGHVKSVENEKKSMPFSDIYIGGAPSEILHSRPELATLAGLRGCLKGFQYQKKDFNLLEEAGTIGISSGCPEESLFIFAKVGRDKLSTPEVPDSLKDNPEELRGKEEAHCYLSASPRATQHAYQFGGTANSRLEYGSIPAFFKERSHFSLSLRTQSTHGLIFYVSNVEEDNFMALFLAHGRLVYMFNVGNHKLKIKSQEKYNDGSWHNVVFTREKNEGRLIIDGLRVLEDTVLEAGAPWHVSGVFYVGGVPPGKAHKNIQVGRDKLSTPEVPGSLKDNPEELRGKEEAHCYLSASPRATQHAYQFGGTANSRLEYGSIPDFFKERSHFSLSLRTQSTHGLIFYVSNVEEDNFMALFLAHGRLVYMFNVGNHKLKIKSQEKYNDGSWHNVVFTREKNEGRLIIDGLRVLEDTVPEAGAPWHVSGVFYVGGVPPGKAHKNIQVNSVHSFTGCVKSFQLNGQWLSSVSHTFGVTPCFNGPTESGTYFSAEGGYVVLDDAFNLGLKFELVFEVRPRASSGILLHVYTSGGEYLNMHINHGQLVWMGLNPHPRKACGNVAGALIRLGRHGKVFLTVPSPGSTAEQKFIQKGEAPGTESLFDLEPDNTVFFVGGVPPDFRVIVQVHNGIREFATSVTPKQGLCDGRWHRIAVIRDANVVQLDVDSEVTHVVGPLNTRAMDSKAPVFIGGVPESLLPQSMLIRTAYIGCMRNLIINETPVSFSKAALKGIYDEALSSFFRNVDTRRSDGDNNDISGGKIRSLKARAVLIDMEEGVVNEILQGPLRDVFDSKQLITDVSGSGNNWAVGHKVYGSTYREEIVENLRKAAEHCDCLQCFFVIHSMGGGTGSGLGTFVLNVLEDEFPEVYRIVTSVYPSAEDDVITSPYNSVLAMRELTEHADCVLPIENQSLVDIVNKIKHMSHSGKLGAEIKQSSTIISGQGGVKGQEKPFDAMNNIVANMLLNLTSSARLDQMFSDAFSKDHQLIHSDPKHSLYLACALIVRGDVQVSDLRRNIERLKPSLPFVSWNQEGWKTGLCSVPPVGHSHSLLALANNTCVKPTFIELKDRFMKLYKKKAHLHHYLHVDGMEQSCFSEAVSSLSSLIEEYNQLDATKGLLRTDAQRLNIAL